MTHYEITPRPARIKDAGEILYFHQALAEYCGSDISELKITQDSIKQTITDPESLAKYVVAEVREELGKEALAGMIYYGRMPTVGWKGVPRYYIEDLFVKEQFRGQQVGRWLLAHVAREAALQYGEDAQISLDTNREDNAATCRFYRNLGCKEELNFRLSGTRLAELASLGVSHEGSFSGTFDW